ncbi:FitA-like ribbon-helix-helix domain-containing protein [Nocardia brasiliensis]|uniref:FitA-like ribbon-helix-helix domain-containing protein n=1 Tax=Nocardia brasiliensis TaxID=37326 RepID=UPI001893FFD0|nr:hypothetical protein [Nocardia brasiliensis]MBF6545339.1 hypothetical protein [Nocardia brasiliensis]
MATIKPPKTKAKAAKSVRKATSANLNVRNLDPATKATIQRRANRNGRSMEAEVRAILTRAADEDSNPTPAVNPLSGAALLGRLAKLREALDGDVPEIGVRHDDSQDSAK